MNLSLDYVKQRMLNAGASLQRVILDIQHDDLTPKGHVFDDVHHAQNQLALALATLVQLEHDRQQDKPPASPYASVSALIRALRDEAERVRPELPSIFVYTQSEQNALLRAAATLEAVHPSLFEAGLDDSCVCAAHTYQGRECTCACQH